MERIHYSGGSVLTGTEIARALLDYAEALASSKSSATVDIPSRHEDGSVGRANFLIGPSSQLVSETETSALEELTEPGLAEGFRAEAAKLRNTTPLVPGNPDRAYTEFDAEGL